MIANIFITGGNGFIGRHLISKLIFQGHYVRVMDRISVKEQSIPGRLEYIPGDFLILENLRDALSGIDVVYHLAVTTIPGGSNESILFDAQTNLMGSLNLIHSAAEAGVKRFIFISSGGSVYGQTSLKAIREDHPTRPISAHGVSKLAIEKYLEIYRFKYGIEYRIARGANPYGEGQNPYRGQGFIAYALAQLAKQEEIVVWGDGSVVRDYFYVGDFIRALALMLDDHTRYRLYNVGSGQGKSIREMIELLEIITGQKARVRYEPSRPADVPFNVLDITRIRKSLAWEPETSFRDGIERTWSWIKVYLSKNGRMPGDNLPIISDKVEVPVIRAKS